MSKLKLHFILIGSFLVLGILSLFICHIVAGDFMQIITGIIGIVFFVFMFIQIGLLVYALNSDAIDDINSKY